LVHLKEFAPFYVGQNFISHVKLMQKFKNNNKRKKGAVEIFFFFQFFYVATLAIIHGEI
jgi:hypothetical protein